MMAPAKERKERMLSPTSNQTSTPCLRVVIKIMWVPFQILDTAVARLSVWRLLASVVCLLR